MKPSGKEKKLKYIREPITSEWYYAIKWFAIIFMVIDHIRRLPVDWGGETYLTLFMVGRMAFPLFAWELSECFHFTKNSKKHLLNIGLLAVISEIPFDKLKGEWFDWNRQNVCFTFLLSWLMLMAIHTDWTKLYEKSGLKIKWAVKLCAKSTNLGITMILFLIAYGFQVDYIHYGMIVVLLFDFSRSRKHRKIWEFISISMHIVLAGIRLTGMDRAGTYITCYFCLILMWAAESNIKNVKENCSEKKFINKLLQSSPSKLICRYFYPLHLTILAITGMVMNALAK